MCTFRFRSKLSSKTSPIKTFFLLFIVWFLNSNIFVLIQYFFHQIKILNWCKPIRKSACIYLQDETWVYFVKVPLHTFITASIWVYSYQISCKVQGQASKNCGYKLVHQRVRLFVITLSKPPGIWFFYAKNRNNILNRDLFSLSGHSFNQIRRKTRDSFTLRGSLVPGKHMEPQAMMECSVYLWIGVNQFSVSTSWMTNA